MPWTFADACGGDWGLRTREAAMAVSGSYADEDYGVMLLQDIRNAFASAAVDRISSRDLAAVLIEIDDAPWSEWRGLHSNQQPRPLSQAQLAQLLRPFDIRPRSMWRGQRPQGKSAKGYYRNQFEAAWRSYCSPTSSRAAPSVVRNAQALTRAGTPAQATEINGIRSQVRHMSVEQRRAHIWMVDARSHPCTFSAASPCC
jgi:hypothetical protein